MANNGKNLSYQVHPAKQIQGEITVPGDKSISHRAVVLGSIADGTTTIKGFLHAEDTLATLRAFQNLSVPIEIIEEDIFIHGRGLHGLKPPAIDLDCGNSGTSMRLLAGVLAGQSFNSTLTGDTSLLSRPMKRITDPLTLMGASVLAQPNGTAPLMFHGVDSLKAIHYHMPIPSAQVKSCLILAALYAKGETVIISPIATRDHTERMLEAFDYKISVSGPKIKLSGGGKLKSTFVEVPSDISSAAFFMVAATILPQSDILLKNIGINPYRIGVINILRLMGGHISFENEKSVGNEYVADIRVRSATLRGIDIPLDQVPLAIDEFPVLFIAAACASGVTVLRGAEELHVKETDRIQVMAEGLQNLGINVETRPDGIAIEGGKLKGGTVNSHGDHRVAMSFAVAGMAAEGETIIEDCANVATSFPNFVEVANELGVKIDILEKAS